MIEIKNSLLTGTIQLDSDKDGNIVIVQNKQELKLTHSQAKDVHQYIQSVMNNVFMNNVFIKQAEDSVEGSGNV